MLLNQLQQEDASSGNNTDSAQQLHQDFDLMKIVDDVQSALRAGVSIQVRNFNFPKKFSYKIPPKKYLLKIPSKNPQKKIPPEKAKKKWKLSMMYNLF